MKAALTTLSLLFFLFIGCATTDPLSLGDTGASVELRNGQKQEIILTGDPTGGRTWRIIEMDESILRLDGSPTVRALAAVGGFARLYEYRFTFIAAGQGTTTLRMGFSGRDDPAPVENFELTFEVR